MIRFLRTKGSSAIEIHQEFRVVYGPVVMSAGNERNVHDEKRSGRSSIQTGEIVVNVDLIVD